MARLRTAGAELGHVQAEGLTATGAAATIQASTPRTGARRFQTTGAANTWFGITLAHVLDRVYWLRDYVSFSSLNPGANPNLILGTVASTWLEARLSLVGGQPAISVHTATGASASWVFGAALSANTYYRFELRYRYSATAGQQVAELKIWDVDDETLLQTITVAGPGLVGPAPTGVFLGHDSGTSSTTAITLSHDDVALNDDQGAAQNASPGPGAVRVLLPVATVANGAGANWRKPGSAAGDKATSADNVPPVFEAIGDVAGNAEDYVVNVTGGTGAAQDASLELQDYAAAGVPAGDSIEVVELVLVGGSTSATDTAGQLTGVSNPAVPVVSFAAFDNGVASATPSTWPRQSSGPVYAPAGVVRATRPVVLLRKNTSTTRVVAVTTLGMIVESKPAAVTVAGADLVATYDVRALEAADLVASYGVRALEQADLAAGYAVRAIAGADLVATYDVVGRVAAELAAVYDVRELAAAELVATFDVLELAGADLSAVYDVRELAAAELVATFDVRAIAGADLVAVFDVVGIAGASLVAVYDVLGSGLAGANLTAVYDVRAHAGADLVASYGVRALEQADLAAGYAVRELARADLVATFDVLELAGADLSAVYGVRGLEAAELVATYDVVGRAAAELAAVYDVLELAGADLVAVYDVRAIGEAEPVVTRRTRAATGSGAGRLLTGSGVTLATVEREGRTRA